MTRTHATLLALAVLAAAPVQAVELVEYADKDGTTHIVQVLSVTKDEEDDFRAKVEINGRAKTVSMPSRMVVEFRRGDTDASNAWSTQLAKGKRLLAAGKLGDAGGAEEVFTNVAYSTEEGIAGQEELFAVEPWHNMYASLYLIETRFEMGVNGKKEMFELVLLNAKEFRDRSAKKKKIEIEIPGQAGATKASVYCWGSSRLQPQVAMFEARALAALDRKDEAVAAFDALIDKARKEYSPHVLADAMIAKAELLAKGADSEGQEQAFRDAGVALGQMVASQPDAFGKQALRQAANRALLRGADFLLASAASGQLSSWQVPLERYTQLRDSAGKSDPLLFVGAQTGVGVCLTEKGEGEAGYRALLDVLTEGAGTPEQKARALYYIGRAAKKFGDEIDSAGGSGDFLRAESARWWSDLKERYPSSEWAKKASEK